MVFNTANLLVSHTQTSDTENIVNKGLKFACSFDPLHPIFEQKNINLLDALKFIHKELMIDNIRLAIRWNKVWENKEVNLDFYKKYFDYCYNNGIKIVLNIGPIKTMRWPEEHIPKELQHLVKRNETITLSSPIASESIDYLTKLIETFKEDYSEHLDKIIAIQADNEAFNRFGKFRVLMSVEFEKEIFRIIQDKFNLPILVNSSGFNDLKKIFNTISKESDVILGINYYYKVPIQSRIPLINKLDNLIVSKAFLQSPNRLKRIAKKYNYRIEVTELQGEPWWPKALTPGNSFKEFVFTLRRVLYLKPKDQKDLFVRYWGIEDFASKFLIGEKTIEHEKIRDLILKIQLQQS